MDIHRQVNIETSGIAKDRRKLSESVSESELFKCLADEKSLRMFRTIYDELPFTISSLNLTRKQYYSRLNMIINAKLVDKSNGRYRATSLGKVVHKFLDFLGTALAKDYWRFTAIDSLTNSNSPLPAEEHSKIVSSLIKNKDTMGILLEKR